MDKTQRLILENQVTILGALANICENEEIRDNILSRLKSMRASLSPTKQDKAYKDSLKEEKKNE